MRPFLARTFPRSVVLAVVLAAVACSTKDNGTIQLVTGEETDTFSRSPVPTELTVYAVTSGSVTPIASAQLPASSIDLGNQNENSIATLEIKANDATGANVVAGASLALQYGALSGGTLPVFVQRTNEWARLPSPPTDARQAPTLAIVSGEFLFIGGGSAGAMSTQLYDFASLTALTAPPALPMVPLSMPIIGTIGLVIDKASATYFDFSQNATLAVTPPTGFTWSDVSGGQVVYDYDSSAQTLDAVFVVGATRTQGAATAAVLEIDATDAGNSSYPTGNLHWITLSQPRLGATATWVPGRGLVVTGGSPTAAGVEVVTAATSSAAGSTSPISAFPPDASMGAGATLTSATQLLVAGGLTTTGQDAGVRVLDLTCASSCGTAGTKAWGPGLPVGLTAASAFSFASGTKYPAMVVGSELTSGLTHAYLLNSTGAKELPTKVPHKNARAIPSPLGFSSVLLFGGDDAIESLFPPLQ